MINREKNFVYSFSPLDALKLCVYNNQNLLYLPDILK
jgi:type 2A phosphatase activator TIP41